MLCVFWNVFLVLWNGLFLWFYFLVKDLMFDVVGGLVLVCVLGKVCLLVWGLVMKC